MCSVSFLLQTVSASFPPVVICPSSSPPPPAFYACYSLSVPPLFPSLCPSLRILCFFLVMLFLCYSILFPFFTPAACCIMERLRLYLLLAGAGVCLGQICFQRCTDCGLQYTVCPRVCSRRKNTAPYTHILSLFNMHSACYLAPLTDSFVKVTHVEDHERH